MATVMLAHESDPTVAKACGIGQTYEIARKRAMVMYMERVCAIRNPTDDDHEAIETDIENGAICEMAFY